MKVIILDGGLGTRISEETSKRPKPMVEINGKPILWHIMGIYASQGYKDFIIATGYKGDVINDWVKSLNNDWNISAIDTGLETQTGGRIAHCLSEYPSESSFMMTYGDGLGNIDISNLLRSHKESGKMVTLTAVHPPARFGYLQISSEDNLVEEFSEKNQTNEGWINGGFFVINKEVTKYIAAKKSSFEIESLPNIARARQLNAYKHEDFWKPMDTLREKNELETLSKLAKVPWMNDRV